MKTSFQTYRSKREAGQALVETAIIYPLIVFMILGVIQLTILHQTRLMMEYAAFNAARTGVVWNGNKVKMRNAALLSLIATQPSSPISDMIPLGKIENYTDLLLQAGVALISAKVEGFGLQGRHLINVDILSPTEEDFGKDEVELDFDSFSGDAFKQRRLGQLSIRLTYFFRLKIPFANWVIWNTWAETRSKELKKKYQAFETFNAMMRQVANMTGGSFQCSDTATCTGPRPFLAFDAKNYSGWVKGAAAFSISGDANDRSQSSTDYEGLRNNDWKAVFFASMLPGRYYYIPLVTAHTMRMQSNLYKCSITGTDTDCCGETVGGK